MMTLEILRGVLGWCIIINFGILLWWFAFITLAHDWTYRIHGKLFKLSEEKFNSFHYAGMMTFKLGIFMFNVVPYFALHIVM